MSSKYALLDFGGLRRLEQWGPIRIVRPDPRAIGNAVQADAEWERAEACFQGRTGRGAWIIRGALPDHWELAHAGLRFEVRLAPSMHLGLFPEQAQQWEWMQQAVASEPPIDVLNLFAYTGGASIALAALGHRVTHVDASRPSVAWARRNAALNHLTTIRWIEDDVREFVRREQRRGRRYRGLLLDPPAFGRADGGVWRLDDDLEPLLEQALALLDGPRFVVLNLYGLDASEARIESLLADRIAAAGLSPDLGVVRAGTLDLHTRDGRALPTGVFARASA